MTAAQKQQVIGIFLLGMALLIIFMLRQTLLE